MRHVGEKGVMVLNEKGWRIYVLGKERDGEIVAVCEEGMRIGTW